MLKNSGQKALPDVLVEFPCEPTNAVALAHLLDGEKPSLRAMVPYFEQEPVLYLRLMGVANQTMKQRSRSPIPVRSVSHALSLIGLEGVQALIQGLNVFTGGENNIHLKEIQLVYLRHEVLTRISQGLARFHSLIHSEDIRLYCSIVSAGQINRVLQDPDAFHVLLLCFQREPIEFWDVETAVLHSTLVDEALNLAVGYHLADEHLSTIELFPGLSQVSSEDHVPSLKKIRSLIEEKIKKQDGTLVLVLCTYAMLSRSAFFWEDKRHQLLLHWISRLLGKPKHQVRHAIQNIMLACVRQYPVMACYGQGIMAQSPLSVIGGKAARERLASYQSSKLSINRVQIIPLEKAKLSYYGPDLRGSRMNPLDLTPVALAPESTQSRPNLVVSRFLDQIQSGYFEQDSTLAAGLLEACRVALSAESCLTLMYEPRPEPGYFRTGNTSGLSSRHPARQWTVDQNGAGLLNHFMSKQVAIWLRGENHGGAMKVLPHRLVNIIKASEAMMASLIGKNDKPLGVILVVGRLGYPFSQDDYDNLKKMVRAARLRG